MLPQVRIVLVTSLATALWFLADAVKFFVSGRFLGQRLTSAEVNASPYALQLTDGSYVDYGIWAAWLVSKGFDPHDMAPIFFGLGVIGLVGLYLFLAARPIGWALLVGFAMISIPRLDAVGISAGVLLMTLVLPATRRVIFQAHLDEFKDVELRPMPETEAKD